MSISCWLSLERSCPIAAISAFSFLLKFGRLALLLARGLQFLLTLLEASGETAVACWVGAADCATAGESDAAIELAETSSSVSEAADINGVLRPVVSGERMFRVECIRPILRPLIHLTVPYARW